MLLYGARGFAEAGHRSDKTAAMAALKSGALKLPKLELSNMKAYVYGAAANRDRNVRPRRNVRRTCAGGDACIYLQRSSANAVLGRRLPHNGPSQSEQHSMHATKRLPDSCGPAGAARSARLSSVENVIADRPDGSSVPRPSGPDAGRVIEQCTGHNRRVQVIVRRTRHSHRLFPGRSVLRGQRAELRP